MPKHESIDDYIDGCTETVAPLMEALRAFVHQTLPGATEGMQYGVPVFYNANKVPVIYLFGSWDHVNFGFLKSADLSDPEGVLEGSGKPSKHISMFPGAPIDEPTLRAVVKQCETLSP